MTIFRIYDNTEQKAGFHCTLMANCFGYFYRYQLNFQTNSIILNAALFTYLIGLFMYEFNCNVLRTHVLQILRNLRMGKARVGLGVILWLLPFFVCRKQNLMPRTIDYSQLKCYSTCAILKLIQQDIQTAEAETR